jgi:ABC-2 type transport system permease protein
VRTAWYIAAKELLQARRDRLAALFTLVLPVIFTVFLGVLFTGFGDLDALPLGVSDLDGSDAARALIERLRGEPALDLQPMSAEELENAVQDQEVAAGLVIPAGYGAALDAGDTPVLPFVRMETSSGARSVFEAVQAAVGRLNAETLAADTAAEQVSMATGASLDDTLRAAARARAATHLATPAVTVELTDSTRADSEELTGFTQASIGALVNWVLFGLLTVAVGLAWERRRGLLLRLNTMRVGGPHIIGGKMMAMVLLTFFQQLFLVLLGQLAFGVDYFNSPVALFVVMISLSVMAASLGLLISSTFRSEQAVIATTVISAQLLAALGGAWFPLEITSETFSRVAHFLPTAWIVDSLHGIVLDDWGILDVLGPMGFVWIWTVVFFGLAIWRYRPS